MASGFYRNGEDAEFDFPAVGEVALSVIEGAYLYEKTIDARGIVLLFRNDTLKVEVVLSGFLEGECLVRSL